MYNIFYNLSFRKQSFVNDIVEMCGAPDKQPGAEARSEAEARPAAMQDDSRSVVAPDALKPANDYASPDTHNEIFLAGPGETIVGEFGRAALRIAI
jgi:hypothetical protein